MTNLLNQFDFTKQQGWSCPKCNAVMNPSYPTCFYCKPIQDKTSNNTGNDIPACLHQWDPLVLTSHPPKIRCIKCNTYSTDLTLLNGSY